jgi:hypothetical protein
LGERRQLVGVRWENMATFCVPAHPNLDARNHGAKRFMRQREQNDLFHNRCKISVYADLAFRDDLNTLASENQVTVSKLLYDMARDYVRREAPLLAERNKVFEDLGW